MNLQALISEISGAAPVIATVAAIVSIILILRQLREIRKGHFSQAVASLYDTFVILDRFFIDHPEMRPFVYDQIEPDDAMDKQKLVAIAEMVTDVLYKAYMQHVTIPSVTFTPEVKYMQTLYSSPIMKSFLTENREWYRNDFVELMIENKAPTKKSRAF